MADVRFGTANGLLFLFCFLLNRRIYLQGAMAHSWWAVDHSDLQSLGFVLDVHHFYLAADLCLGWLCHFLVDRIDYWRLL